LALTGVALIVAIACGAYFGISKGKVRKVTQYVIIYKNRKFIFDHFGRGILLLNIVTSNRKSQYDFFLENC